MTTKTEYLQLKGSDLYLGKLLTFDGDAGCRFFYRKALSLFDGDAECQQFSKDFASRANFIAWLNVPEASIAVKVSS